MLHIPIVHAHDVSKQIPREARVTTPRELLRLEQLLRIFRALQTSRVLHISMNARWHMNQLLIVEESNVYDWPFFLFANTMTVLTVDFEMVSGAHTHDKNKQYYFCFLFFAIRAISVFWRNFTRNSRVRQWVFLNTFLVCHELKIRKLAGRIFLTNFSVAR